MAGAGAPGLAGASGGDATVAGDRLRDTAGAVPEAGSGTPAAGFIVRESFSVPLRFQTRRHSMRVVILPATSRSGATGTNPGAFWFRRGLSTVARSAETSRWYGDWRRPRRSSGRYWPPARRFGDRPELPRSAGPPVPFRTPLR